MNQSIMVVTVENPVFLIGDTVNVFLKFDLTNPIWFKITEVGTNDKNVGYLVGHDIERMNRKFYIGNIAYITKT